MALRCFMHGKIHRATVTEARLDYEGSLSICPALMRASTILPHEQVEVYNLRNGERLRTYAIEGSPGGICLNGAAALKGMVGDKIIIVAYSWLTPEEVAMLHPRIVLVDEANQPTSPRSEQS
jgi:aspartate 1-decarboxylase